MIEARLCKIKEGKEETLRNWFQELNTTRRNEAIETLENEGVLYESGSILRIDDNYYSLITTASNGPVTPSDTTQEINHKHREILKECLDKTTCQDITGIYDLP